MYVIAIRKKCNSFKKFYCNNINQIIHFNDKDFAYRKAKKLKDWNKHFNFEVWRVL